MRSHAAAAVRLWEDAGYAEAEQTVATIMRDPATAPISAKDRLLLHTVELWTLRRHELSQQSIDDLLASGWEASQVYEANAVCSLFCFYNAWVDNNGVEDMSEASYRASGKRLAEGGYL